MTYLNIVGPQVMRLRVLRGWSQEMLSEKLRLAGWSVTGTSLAKLELRVLPVADHHLFFLAKIFDVPLSEMTRGQSFCEEKACEV